MKKKFIFTLFLILILIANISLASYETVTMTVVEEPICTIKIGENSKFEKKLIEKNLSNKEVKLQLQVTNEEIASQPSGEIMLVLDNSLSMSDTVNGTTTTREDLVVNSAETLIASLLKDNQNLKIGVVSFSTNEDVSKEGTLADASLVSELSTNPDTLKSAISNIKYTGPRTDLEAGLSLASQYFSKENNNKYIIILTDGVPNVALNYDKVYYSDDVITKTKAQLQSLGTNKYNVITMLTGISKPDDIPATRTDTKTYADIIKEIFGTTTQPTIGKFYYIQDNEIEQTITKNIYNDLMPTEKILKNIEITDYFPKEIIDNFEFAYVSNPNIGITTNINTNTNSITWTIPELKPNETAKVQYTLKLKKDFNSSIVGKILNTNQKVDINYLNFDENKVSDTSDITPKLKLLEAPTILPKAGTPIFITLFTISIGLSIYSFIKFFIVNKNLKH